MRKGFFAASQMISKAPISMIPRCGACGLFEKCKSPKMPVYGEGKRGIMILGEAPGQNEDQRGRPFVGRAGELLREVLRSFDIEMDRDCWATNALICHPWERDEQGDKKNRTPTDDEIDYCRPNVLRAMREHKPNMVITLGGIAVKSLLGHFWKEDIGTMTRWAGWRIPCHNPNAWICPTFHPSYVVRERDKPKPNTLPLLFFKKHLEAALKKRKRPWQELPDFASQVQRIHNPEAAAEAILQFVNRSELTGFDFETNMLKPDHPNAYIASCSISDGVTTISYPWHGPAITASLDFIKSKTPKVASNAKFEDRWSRARHKTSVRNWTWDTMLGAHWLDSRRHITSIKFQAFVHIGAPSWNDHIEPFLKADLPNQPNRIKEVDLDQLLLYGGLDSLYEVLVAEKQMKTLELDEEGD